MERALVSFGHWGTAIILQAQGDLLRAELDEYAVDNAEDLGLPVVLVDREDVFGSRPTLAIWEGVPRVVGVVTGGTLEGDEVSYADGAWRALTADEWAQIAKHGRLAWP